MATLAAANTGFCDNCEFYSPDISLGSSRTLMKNNSVSWICNLTPIKSKSLSNYNTSLRMMQHVMLTFAPNSCFILQYPEDRDRETETETEREREGDDTRAHFWVSLSPWKPTMKTQRWQMSEKQWALPHSNLSGEEVFWLRGRWGALMCTSCLCTCDGCVEQNACAQAQALSVPSCHIDLSFRHRWRETFPWLRFKFVRLASNTGNGQRRQELPQTSASLYIWRETLRWNRENLHF